MTDEREQTAQPSYVPKWKPLDMQKHIRTETPRGGLIVPKSYFTTGRAYCEKGAK
jgi:hypothetical protein